MNANNSTDILKNSKSFLGLSIGTRRSCLMKKTGHKISRDTVPLTLFLYFSLDCLLGQSCVITWIALLDCHLRSFLYMPFSYITGGMGAYLTPLTPSNTTPCPGTPLANSRQFLSCPHSLQLFLSEGMELPTMAVA